MYTFICTTAGSFGHSSWPGGRFSRLLTMWEKISLFLSFLPFFLASLCEKILLHFSQFLSQREIFSGLLPMWEIFSHMNRELCMDSTYMFLAFSLCEKNFLHFSQFSLYVRNFFSPSPNVRNFFSPSPLREKIFLTFSLRWENFSHIGEVWPVWAYSITPTWPSNSRKRPLVFPRFIVQEKPTVTFPVGEGLPEVPYDTWYLVVIHVVTCSVIGDWLIDLLLDT